MYSFIYSSSIVGMSSFLVRVEVDVSNGLPGFDIVGMASSEVKEAKERVKVALKNIGITLPPKKITVNLSPANIRKSGTSLDLPIAIGMLSAAEMIPPDQVNDMLFLGELGLNAELKFISGVLPSILMAKKHGIKRCIIPKQNISEGSVIKDIEVLGFDNLFEIIDYLVNGVKPDEIEPPGRFDLETLLASGGNYSNKDFADVYGQEGVKRVAQIAAAGFHHFMMVGPPGAGKSMIAKRIPSILPPLSMKESLEISQIYSIKGLLSRENPFITSRPFLSPHHTTTVQAMIGGGFRVQPGIISMAHRGVLFLDEAPHFSKEVLEVLRQPLEDKKVEVTRVGGSFIFPADFMLVLACNPCPCGYYPDRNKCRCTENEIKRYMSKISGPIMDRIDLCVTAYAVSLKELNGENIATESSEDMRKRIEKAREIQKKRFAGTGLTFNSEIGSKEIKKYCKMDEEAKRYMEIAFERLQLSARGYHKILKVARTIADLDGAEMIGKKHLTEAIGYRIRPEYDG
ncbi:MAG: YifB family Mg chelatase-like AAA ATPase [Lachnospiraceae bacterium]|nr:YifB family Mg chelatase-like AAA ATPase [Lachnospiraceae bacterium]